VFKQLWSIISAISTKQITTSHNLNTKKNTILGVGNPDPGLGQAQKCGRVKQHLYTKICFIFRWKRL